MSFFTTSVQLHHRTPLPPGIARETAIAVCHDHDVILRFDPELAHYEAEPAPEPNPRQTQFYKVTDHMQALPKGLWDSTVTFQAEVTNEEHGNEYVVKAPLGLVQTTKWRLEPAPEGELYPRQDDKTPSDAPSATPTEWVLVEEVEIRASRLLVGTVKSKCEGNWRNIHDKFIAAVLERQKAT